MNDITTTNSTAVLIEMAAGRPTTTSLDVAEHFGKRHDNVIKAIRNLDCSPEFHALNFEEMIVEVEIGNGATRSSPAFRLTRDGFTFLCMDFTGAEAAKWKEAYIDAFNRMEAAIKGDAVDPRPSLITRRWLISYDHNGKEIITEVPLDAHVMTHKALLQAMLRPDALMVSTDELFEFAMATLTNLKARSDYMAAQTKKAKEAGFQI